MQRFLVALALVLGGSSWTAEARASSDAGSCAAPLISPVPGALPVNVPGFVLRLRGGEASSLRLVRIEEDGAETTVETTWSWVEGAVITVALVPAEPFVVGARYEVRIAPCFGPDEVAFAYEAIDEVPRPVELGTVAISPLQVLRFDVESFFVAALLHPDPELAPWLGLYMLEFVAETEAGATPSRPRHPLTTHGLTQHFPVACGRVPDPSSGVVPAGALTVRVRATSIFDPDDTLEALGTTTNDCDRAIDVTPRDALDGGALDIDGGVEPTPAPTMPASGGCTCRAAGGRGSPGGALALLLALVALTAQRIGARRS